MRAREVASGQARLTSLSITRIDTAADAPGCAVSSLCNNRAHPGGLEEGGAGTEAAAVRTARSAGISLHALEVRAYSKGRQSREVWAHGLGETEPWRGAAGAEAHPWMPLAVTGFWRAPGRCPEARAEMSRGAGDGDEGGRCGGTARASGAALVAGRRLGPPECWTQPGGSSGSRRTDMFSRSGCLRGLRARTRGSGIRADQPPRYLRVCRVRDGPRHAGLSPILARRSTATTGLSWPQPSCGR